jgi:hypothetical protein
MKLRTDLQRIRMRVPTAGIMVLSLHPMIMMIKLEMIKNAPGLMMMMRRCQ